MTTTETTSYDELARYHMMAESTRTEEAAFWSAPGGFGRGAHGARSPRIVVKGIDHA